MNTVERTYPQKSLLRPCGKDFCYDELVPHLDITACVRVGSGRNRIKTVSSRSTNGSFAITGVDHQSEMQSTLDQISFTSYEQPLPLERRPCACFRVAAPSVLTVKWENAPASGWYIWNGRGDGKTSGSPHPTTASYHLLRSMALSTSICSHPPASLASKQSPRKTIISGFSSIFSNVKSLLAPPTRTEMGACWELCRLQNGMGCATVFLPVAWSLAMVYHAYPELTGMACLTRAAIYFFLCIGIKCLIMTIDDILDYDIDANVERTKNRALPRGAISIERAWLFFVLQVVIGVFLAYKVLSPDALRISMYVWPLYVLYPTCKRWMYFAPIPLGLMFNIGVYMGWADLAPDSKIPYVALGAAYLGATMWTITYETVYQHQDKVDDVKIGMKSLAILCGRYTIPVCSATTIGFAGLMSLAGYLNDQGIAFYIAVALSAFVLLKGLMVTDVDKPRECMQFFLHTPTIGNLILAGLAVDAVVHRVIEGIPL